MQAVHRLLDLNIPSNDRFYAGLQIRIKKRPYGPALLVFMPYTLCVTRSASSARLLSPQRSIVPTK